MRGADLIVLALYLAALLLLVLRFRKTPPEPAEYFLARRSFGAWPVGLSVMVTTFSAVNYLAFPGEVCSYGLYVIGSLPVFFLAAWPVTRWWMPFFIRLQPVSVYAFLEERFDRRVRLLASGIFLVWRFFWMAVALYASSRVMAALTGVDFMVLLLAGGVVAALYSSIGGMRAVVWTDVMQFAVIFGSIILGAVLACRGADWSALLAESGRLRPFFPADWSYFGWHPTARISFWSALLGTFVTFLTRFGADQMVMQRYISARSLGAARKGLWLNAAVSVLALGMLVIFGLAVHLHARRAGMEILPPVRLVAELLKSFPAGATGLIAAGLLAATMSSIDSGVNSASAALVTDFPAFRRISPRLLTLLIALAVIGGAAWILPELNKNNTLFAILNRSVNAMGTPLLAIMLCALFGRRIHAAAVFAGALTGFVLTLWFSATVRDLALHYYAVVSLLLTLAAVAAAEGVTRLAARRGR